MNMRIITFCLLITVLSGFLPSCKKKDSSPNCKIMTLTDTSSSGTATINITYNNDGKISTLTQVSGSTTTNKVYTYNSTTIIINSTSGGTFAGLDSITLNSNNKPVNSKHYYNSSLTSWYNDSYQYDGSGNVITDFYTASGSSPSTTTFSYTNGDLTQATSTSSTTTLEYYTDQPYREGDYFEIFGLINGGVQLIKNAHPVKSLTNASGVTNFSYTVNNNGQISRLVYTQGANVETLSYQYLCN